MHNIQSLISCHRPRPSGTITMTAPRPNSSNSGRLCTWAFYHAGTLSDAYRAVRHSRHANLTSESILTACRHWVRPPSQETAHVSFLVSLHLRRGLHRHPACRCRHLQSQHTSFRLRHDRNRLRLPLRRFPIASRPHIRHRRPLAKLGRDDPRPRPER